MHVNSDMRTAEYRVVYLSVPVVGTEVLTLQLPDGSYEVRVHGGRLDGESYPAGRSESLALGRHEAVARLAWGAAGPLSQP